MEQAETHGDRVLRRTSMVIPKCLASEELRGVIELASIQGYDG